MPRRPTTSAKSAPREPRLMSGAAFVRELSKRQRTLLDQMVDAVNKGTLQLENTEDTDRYIEHVVSDWCTQQEPDLDAHMQLLGAVFLWALLDATYGNEADGSEDDKPATGVDVALEALRTIQAIWGVRNG